jgi:hypothetical protein
MPLADTSSAGYLMTGSLVAQTIEAVRSVHSTCVHSSRNEHLSRLRPAFNAASCLAVAAAPAQPGVCIQASAVLFGGFPPLTRSIQSP